MYTANTMACVSEAIGLALLGSATVPAVDRRRSELARRTGLAAASALEQGLRPRDIVTRHAIENAMTVSMAVGGSTNSVLHLLAIAWEANVDFDLDAISAIGKRTPQLVDTRPHGAHFMVDLDKAGGVPAVLAELANAELLNLEALTVTGRSLGDEIGLAHVHCDRRVVAHAERPIHPTGGTVVLHGRLAPAGAVLKTAGTTRAGHQGPARTLTPKRICSTSCSAALWSRERSSSCAMKVRLEDLVCAKCWPRPPRSTEPA